MASQKAGSSLLAHRVAAVLSAFATAGPKGVADIHRITKLDKSVVHRILRALVEEGFLEQDPTTRQYQVGLRLWEVGNRYPGGTGFVDVAVPPLRDLAQRFDVTGYLGCLDRYDIVYLALVDGPGPIRIHVTVGSRVPAHATALGKALLGYVPPEKLSELLPAMVRQPSPSASTITSVRRLKKEIAEARDRGYTTVRDEYTPGVGSVGAPILGRDGQPIAAVSVSFPTHARSDSRWDDLSRELVATAREIERRLAMVGPAGTPSLEDAPQPDTGRT